MQHKDLTMNHRLESWVFANTAARNAAGTYVLGDVGRIGFQTDTHEYWRLTGTAPTWQAFGPVYAMVQTTQASPTPTGSTIGVMMGLGNAAKITPTGSGKLLFTIVGNILNNTANVACYASMLYGTGTPPSNGAGSTGTPIGTQARQEGVRAANVTVPFCLTGVITGAVLGTELWIDVLLATGAGGNAAITIVAATLVELP